MCVLINNELFDSSLFMWSDFLEFKVPCSKVLQNAIIKSFHMERDLRVNRNKSFGKLQYGEVRDIHYNSTLLNTVTVETARLHFTRKRAPELEIK